MGRSVRQLEEELREVAGARSAAESALEAAQATQQELAGRVEAESAQSAESSGSSRKNCARQGRPVRPSSLPLAAAQAAQQEVAQTELEWAQGMESRRRLEEQLRAASDGRSAVEAAVAEARAVRQELVGRMEADAAVPGGSPAARGRVGSISGCAVGCRVCARRRVGLPAGLGAQGGCGTRATAAA